MTPTDSSNADPRDERSASTANAAHEPSMTVPTTRDEPVTRAPVARRSEAPRIIALLVVLAVIAAAVLFIVSLVQRDPWRTEPLHPSPTSRAATPHGNSRDTATVNLVSTNRIDGSRSAACSQQPA